MIDINIEYKNINGEYPVFFEKNANKKICVACDANTRKFAEPLAEKLKAIGCVIDFTYFDDEELVPNESACGMFIEDVLAFDCDYVLAVGSGTLNDMTKYVSHKVGLPCGVLATAPSMDGYCSKGAALMVGGKKISYETHIPKDVLIDTDIIANAPKMMIASGFGDIIGKYTCLLDWRLSHEVNGEVINESAFEHMVKAREACVSNYIPLASGEKEATSKLMDALLAAGLAMAECGNSRPASGSEHHMSHFLEMDFVARGEKIPMHGIKVAIGTLISIEAYNYLKRNDVKFKGSDKVYEYVKELPTTEEIEKMLIKVGCPTRFSEIGVREETFDDMFRNAYKLRDRYTVLTLIHDLGLTEEILPVVKKYF